LFIFFDFFFFSSRTDLFVSFSPACPSLLGEEKDERPPIEPEGEDEASVDDPNSDDDECDTHFGESREVELDTSQDYDEWQEMDEAFEEDEFVPLVDSASSTSALETLVLMLLEHRSVNATSQKSLEDFLSILRVDGVAHPSLASKLPKTYAQAEKIVSHLLTQVQRIAPRYSRTSMNDLPIHSSSLSPSTSFRK